jgi:hypothetical protein
MNYWIHDFMKPCRRDQTPHIATAPRSGSCRDSDANNPVGRSAPLRRRTRQAQPRRVIPWGEARLSWG